MQPKSSNGPDTGAFPFAKKEEPLPLGPDGQREDVGAEHNPDDFDESKYLAQSAIQASMNAAQGDGGNAYNDEDDVDDTLGRTNGFSVASLDQFKFPVPPMPGKNADVAPGQALRKVEEVYSGQDDNVDMDIQQTLSAGFSQLLQLNTGGEAADDIQMPSSSAAGADIDKYLRMTQSIRRGSMVGDGDMEMTASNSVLASSSSRLPPQPIQLRGLRTLSSNLFNPAAASTKFVGMSDAITSSRSRLSFSRSGVRSTSIKGNSFMQTTSDMLYNFNVQDVQDPFTGRSIAEAPPGVGVDDTFDELSASLGFSTAVGHFPTPLYGNDFENEILPGNDGTFTNTEPR